ncbi:hypothetical protein GGR42_003372 [Saonia flava]|uniref:GSCFA domain-containing protein n=1 Tax=Saonia flava TaxID=523696 RepID=A0A846R663_9FLAO|nr:GSCFA domain-containing protein [Saonia flava]NJB72874.1 hypothetical protein [Saonia flava]
MKLQTTIPLEKASNQIDYNSKLLLLGSCFVENIEKKLDYFKFQSVQNPFGILFHPMGIENLIVRAIENKKYTKEEVFKNKGQWLCFDAHSNLTATSKEQLILNLNGALKQTKEQITKATHIVITLGTAWIYRRRDSGKIVANCHKVPQKEFSKELLSINEIVKSLEQVIQLISTCNTQAQLIFTISPVRHLKDGFVENQLSKAHLIAAMHQLISFRRSKMNEKSKDTLRFLPVAEITNEISNLPPENYRNLNYFESYELMMDELRDYRFYAKDMVHPNELAIDYIWEKFKHVWILDKLYPTMDEVDTIQKGLRHRPFNPESEEHQKFLKSIQRKIAYLKESHPFMEF